MTATTITKAQKNLYQLVENVNDGYTPVIIVNENEDGKNAVLISERRMELHTRDYVFIFNSGHGRKHY